MENIRLNVYYKKDDREAVSIYTQSDVYAEFIRCYHYLKSIKAEFKLDILTDDNYLVRVNYTNNTKMIAINTTLTPYHKQHYIQEYLYN